MRPITKPNQTKPNQTKPNILTLGTVFCLAFGLAAGGQSVFAAVDFDGVDDYVDAGNPASLRITGSLTIAAWVKADSFPNGDDNYIFTKAKAGFNAYKITATIDNAVEQFYICVSSNGSTTIRRYTSTTISTGVWYHVAGVFDAGAQTLNIYLNGTLNNGTLVGVVPSSTYDNTSDSVKIGATTQDALRYFDGLIDDVRIYNRALSAAEVEIIAASRLKYGSVTNGLVGYWPMDDCGDGTSGDGITFVDRSGSGNNGTGVDGANNTGLTCKGSPYLSYPRYP